MRYCDTPAIDVAIHVDAPPARVWPLVTDIHLIAEISPELMRVEWQGDVTGPAVGATFVGHSYHKAVGEWRTTSIVTEYDEPKVFAWMVSDVDNPTAIWRFTLRPERDGTLLTQWAQMGPGPSNLTFAIERWPDKEERIVAGRLAEFQAGMTANLARIKELSEQAEA